MKVQIENVKKKFAENFVKIRVKNLLTVKQLAEKSELSRMQIYHYQSGMALPTAYNLEKLAQALNCEVKDFFE